MTAIDPVFYRTELGLATNGDWYLMRDGKVIATLTPDPGAPASVFAARAWATAELAGLGITVTAWLNGVDVPPQDSPYWVTEPQPDAPVQAVAS